LTVFLVGSAWGDVVLRIEPATLFLETSGNTLNFSMDSPDDEVAALQVDILFDTDCFTVTAVEKTDRTSTMDIFNYSDIDGGIRIAMTGIGHSIAPGTGPIAAIGVDVGVCDEGDYPWDVTGCVVADPLGGEIACAEEDNAVTVMEAACVPELSAASFDLGDVRVGTTGTAVLTVTNVGSAAGDVEVEATGCACRSVEFFFGHRCVH
jgi:hypothetical protein